MLSLVGLSLLRLTLLLGTVSADVALMTSTNETFRYSNLEASFGKRIPASGIMGVIHGASPSDGCSPLTNSIPPEPPLHYAFVLVERGICTFDTKVRNAQAAGFDAVIVYNNEDNDDMVTMTGDPEGVHIHPVFVPKSAGEKMLTCADDMGTACNIRRSYENTSWVVIVVVVISFLAIFAAVALHCFLRRHRHYRTMIYRILNGEELTSQFHPNELR